MDASHDDQTASRARARSADGADGERATARAPDDPLEAAPDAIFDALWRRVEESWDDDEPHHAALSYALDQQMLPEIAGRYRALLDDPDKAARAKKKIDGIVSAATQMLFATRTPPREKVPWTWTLSLALACALVAAFLVYKILFRR